MYEWAEWAPRREDVKVARPFQMVMQHNWPGGRSPYDYDGVWHTYGYLYENPFDQIAYDFHIFSMRLVVNFKFISLKSLIWIKIICASVLADRAAQLQIYIYILSVWVCACAWAMIIRGSQDPVVVWCCLVAPVVGCAHSMHKNG